MRACPMSILRGLNKNVCSTADLNARHSAQIGVRMIYAPVVIPTLNRDMHLKRCIESLQRNAWALMTELYISLDYPPAEKYLEGYEKVKAFLEEGISGFKAVHIYVQEKNLGAVANTEFLKEKIVEDGYDRCIYSEDDNEFSHNFLEYMDKNLEYFENDEKALGVCAAQRAGLWHSNNGNLILQYTCPAYGLGLWIHKDKIAQQRLNGGFINEIGKDPRLLKKVRKRSNLCFRAYMSSIVFDRDNIFWDKDGGIYYCDTMRTLYAMATDAYHVAPLHSKARNWGYDGTGLNMAQEAWNPVEYYPLDTDEHYDIVLPDPFCVDRRNTQMHNRQLRIGIKRYLVAYIAYVIYLFLGRDYTKCISFRKWIISGKQ